jgi:predicted phage tail protein
LSWQPPTTNTNGSAIGNLAGYTIYYGTNPNSYSSVKVANPGLTSYTVSNLPAGSYSFTVVAYNSAGESSQDSKVVTKTIK